MEKHKVVLLEDNPADVFLLRRALREAGLECEMKELDNGEDALQHLHSRARQNDIPDLILLDLNVPRQEGADVLRELRTLPAFRDALIIVVTSSQAPSDRQRVEEYGAIFLTKPADLDEFMQLGQVIRGLLEQKSTT